MVNKLVAKHDRAKAAALASTKHNNVHNNLSSTALWAARRGGKEPLVKQGRQQLYIPAEIEYKLQDLVLVLRQMQLPICRFMIINYAKGTEIAE